VPITDRLQGMVTQIEAALPKVLALTNQISAVLNNAAALTSNLNEVANNVRPAASNLDFITSNLRGPKGSLGEWLIPTNISAELDSALKNANLTITNADTNMVALAESIQKSLDNLADITGNLNAQVQANSNVVKELSDIIMHTDEFVQGLKHHWLLRSAFKTPKTNTPAGRSGQPILSPRAAGQRQ
jgi:methyl-accepting chemotaxis protein